MERAVPSEAVRLLGNFDQYVLAAGRGSSAFIPAEHRAEVSRAAGWISKVVLHGGRVAGVWDTADDGSIVLDLWDSVPRSAIATEIARVGAS